LAVKPILKWVGGKRWLVPIIAPLWTPHAHKKLVEPFSGGLAISLGLNPKKALLNDVNPHLINFYQQVRKGLTISTPFKNERHFYYEKRAEFNALILKECFLSAKAAGLFYYLIRTGFNGLCRFNQKGEFNVPFGQHHRIIYKYCFKDYQSILKSWIFTHQDFANLPLKGDEFIYADPPYDVEFTQYHSKGFTFEDQIRLCEWLAKHQGSVIASNQATKRIVALYKDHGFHIKKLPAPRTISCNGDRRPAIEMLALKRLDY